MCFPLIEIYKMRCKTAILWSIFFNLLRYCLLFFFGGGLHLQGPARITTDENMSTKTLAAWGGMVADLSKQKVQKPFLNGLLLGLMA